MIDKYSKMNQFIKRIIIISSFVLIFLLLVPKNTNFHTKLSYENQFISLKTSASINVINPTSGTVVNLTESSQLRVTWNTNEITGSQILLYKGGELVYGWSEPHLCYSDPCSYNILVSLPTDLAPGNDYKIKVINMNYANEYDYSGSFTIINENYVEVEVEDPKLSIEGLDIILLTSILIPVVLSVLFSGAYLVVKKRKIIVGEFEEKTTLSNKWNQQIQQVPPIEMQKQTSNKWEIQLLPIFTWFSLSFLTFIGSLFFTYNYGAEVPQSTNFVNVFRLSIEAPKESIVMLLFGGFEGLILIITSIILLNLQKIDKATKVWAVGLGLLFLNWLIIPLFGLPGIGWVIYFFVCFGFLMTFLAFWNSKPRRKTLASYSMLTATRCIECRTQDDLTSYRFKKSFDMGRAFVWGSRRYRNIKTLQQSVPVCQDCLNKYKKWNHYSQISIVLLLTGFLILIFGSLALMMRNFWGNGFLSSFMSGLCIFIGGVIVFIYVRFMEINLSKYLKFRKRTNNLYVKPKGASNWVLFNEFLRDSSSTD